MHVAIIMDGNGRWAEQRGLRRTAGHEAGARAVRKIVEAAVRADIEVLTLYAFSSDNWSRPADEVDRVMRLFQRYLQSEAARCVENGVRLSVIGRRDRLSSRLLRIMERTEQLTSGGRRLMLQLAVDYSARDAILRAAQSLSLDFSETANGADRQHASSGHFAGRIAAAIHSHVHESSVDLLIRTGGERRLSDFLLWECAYAELVFVEQYWPDFDEPAFHAALAEFERRDRRFGGLADNRPARLAGDAI